MLQVWFYVCPTLHSTESLLDIAQTAQAVQLMFAFLQLAHLSFVHAYGSG